MQTLSKRLTAFIRHESAAGLLLAATALLALILDNSALSWAYDRLLETPVAVRVGALAIDKPLLLWINDGLMAVFFFLIGLEIKREFMEGELAGLDRALLPGIAALGGMLVPVLVYAFVNRADPSALRGAAIPAATDIAFAMAVLALLGRRVPAGLRAFLLALAIIDDLGSILIIAVFYTSDLSTLASGLAALCIAVLVAINFAGVRRPAAYLLVGVVLWLCILKSGVHATLAGVVTALAVPLRNRGVAAGQPSLLHHLEEALHPWVAYAILPIFAFANAGVSLAGITPARLLEPIPLGIAAGLFLGKQVGIFAFTWIAVRLGLGRLAEGISWTQIYGIALVAGIGFTMSLFIGTLAFPDPGYAASIRLGVIAGSLVSGVAGYLVLRFASTRPTT